jgi:hypothetical protein
MVQQQALDDGLGPLAGDVDLYLRMRSFLGRFSYKPGWRLRAIAPATVWEPGRLVVEHDELDARRPWGPPVTVHGELRLPRFDVAPDDAQLAEWLLTMLLGLEDHEAREWFRLDGRRPFDPHA